jgi:microcystin-dependent protein
MTFWKWSRTASANATADSTCPFPEGMAPSAVNDGIRGAMAAVAKYRDDIAGSIVTGGTSTAYTLSSYQVFDSLVHMDGATIAFAPHTGNGGTATLNIDGLGAKPLRLAPGIELPSSSLVLGTPYVATYFNTTGEWILQGGGYVGPYSIPLLGCMDYFGSTAPNSSFIFPRGQALSRITYAAAFAIVGTTYGSGDGSTTFNVPDLSGRVTAMIEMSATRLTSSYFGGNSTLMGATGGAESQTLTTPQIPSHTHTGTTGNNNQSLSHNHAYATGNDAAGGSAVPSARIGSSVTASSGDLPHAHSFTSDATGGAGAHVNVQPTITCNKVMRVL